MTLTFLVWISLTFFLCLISSSLLTLSPPTRERETKDYVAQNVFDIRLAFAFLFTSLFLYLSLSRDAAALAQFWFWLEEEINKGMKLTEVEVADKLLEFRLKQAGFIDTSFDTISGTLTTYLCIPKLLNLALTLLWNLIFITSWITELILPSLCLRVL